MHCPNCGANAADNQKFCRSCGFSLEKIADLLSEHQQMTRPETDADQLPASREERLIGWGIVTSISVFSLALVTLIVKVLMIDRGEIWKGAGTLAFLAGIALYIFLIGRWQELQQQKDRSRKLSAARNTARLLNQTLPHNPHVTEHTTDLLEPLPLQRTSGKIKS